MQDFAYMDCRARFDGRTLLLESDAAARLVSLEGGAPRTLRLTNRKSGRVWENPAAPPAALSCPCLEFAAARVEFSAETAGPPLRAPHLRAELRFTAPGAAFTVAYTLWPGLGFFGSETFLETEAGADLPEAPADIESDVIEALSFDVRHLKLECFDFLDRSDYNDHLLLRQSRTAYHRGKTALRGRLFLLDDYVRGEGLLLCKHAPLGEAELAPPAADLEIDRNQTLRLRGHGVDFGRLSPGRVPFYSATIGVGASGELKAGFRAYLRGLNAGRGELFTMVNTWGDRGGPWNVREDFALAEVEAAAGLGADVLSLDDGWQTGSGGFPHPWEGYHRDFPDFWTPRREAFPRGLDPVFDRARALGLDLGLWFSPDSADSFETWEKDTDLLWGYHTAYGAREFKLDGVKVRDKAGEARFLAMLEELARRGGGALGLNMDVTAGLRFGYLYAYSHGVLFVENRYTDWGNYYPHNTLKNLWLLSDVLPPRRMQFEVPNPRRNAALYGDDPLAPAKYPIDTLFAGVMVSNPLLWMEAQRLEPADAEALRRVIAAWRPHRRALFGADVRPVGCQPDGLSFTGFQAKTGPDEGYLVLLRENTPRADYAYALEGLADKELDVEVLAANTGYGIGDRTDAAGALAVRMEAPRSFVFARYRTKQMI